METHCITILHHYSVIQSSTFIGEMLLSIGNRSTQVMAAWSVLWELPSLPTRSVMAWKYFADISVVVLRWIHPLSQESNAHRWIPQQKARNAFFYLFFVACKNKLLNKRSSSVGGDYDVYMTSQQKDVRSRFCNSVSVLRRSCWHGFARACLFHGYKQFFYSKCVIL